MANQSLKKNGGLQFPRPGNDDRHNGGAASRLSEGAHRVRFPDDVDGGSSSPLGVLMDMFTAAIAVVCIAGLSTILVVLYVTVRPFSQPVYRRLAAQVGAASFIDALAILVPNTKIFLTGDSDIPSPVGTSLLVSNHLMDADWWAVFMLGRCVGLRGSIKVFLRNEYLHINVNGDSQHPRTNGSTLSTSSFVSMGPSSGTPPTTSHHNPQDLSLLAKLLHLFLDFPLINGEDYISNRNQLFQLLRSFAENDGVAAPVHLLFFPEGWSQHNGADRRSILAKSNEFAHREGRPQLKHLLLPRARGFNASLECLRESSPVVYDVTMAYRGYDGSLPPSVKLSTLSLWNILRRKFPREVHLRIKRYSMEEVLQDTSWLDKKWAEKDRLLSHFARHQSFPADGRGYCRYRVFDSRHYSLESSSLALIRLLLVPCAVPILLFLSIPLFWTFVFIWLAHRAFRLVFPDPDSRSAADSRPGSVEGAGQTPGSNSAGTPFFPATPFASPSITSWRDMFTNRDDTSS